MDDASATDRTVDLTVNNKPAKLYADPGRSLLEAIREDLGLTGTRDGCGTGDCGSCAVHLDGKRALACTVGVEDAAGRSVTTIEGLAEAHPDHPAIRAWIDDQAFQCGFCTSGMIMTLVALAAEHPNADEAAIREGMNGNICRCCGYAKIFPTACKAHAACAPMAATTREAR